MASWQEPGTAELCATCSGLLSTPAGLKALASKAGYQHLNRAETEQSAASGCLLCQKLAAFWPHNTIPESDRLVFWAVAECNRCLGTCEVAEVGDMQVSYPYTLDGIRCWVHRNGVNRNIGMGFTLFAKHDDGAAAWIRRRPIVTEVGSEFALDTARQWLATCLETHPACLRPEVPHVPTRLIDVGTQGDGWPVRLHITKPSERYAYAALSYCWGGPQPVVLTAQNIDDMVREIPFHQLPQTVKDAVKVTRRLGIRFLWIDALCIIQEGDESDKLRELGVMGRLYKSATVTIAAASAASVSEGFLQARTELPSIPMSFHCGGREMGIAHLIVQTGHDAMRLLDKRGWTLQEALLSPRKLVYGDIEQVWFCQTEHRKQFPGSPVFSFSLLGLLPNRILVPGGTMDIERAHSVWSRVVNMYTERQLSFPEDRLAALMGLIAELKPVFEDECTFGIWHRNFVRQLAWYKFRRPSSVPNGDEEKALLSCAPAWSWASRYFPTMFARFEPYDEHCWKLKDNGLVLRGKLARAHDVPVNGRGGWTFDWDMPSPELLEPLFVAEYDGRDVYYFLLGHEPDFECRKLLLALVQHGLQGVYRRIGLAYSPTQTTAFDNEESQEFTLV